MEIVLIPALQPDEKLLTLLEALQAQKLQAVVIDDGSGDAYDEIFQAAEQYGAVVRRLAHNRGKGGALKYGLQQIMQLFPACSGVITADADGQHRINDIRAVQQELQRGAAFVLTVRNLRGKIPKKSKLGNTLSRYVYTVFTGHYFADNQSGLRGFSAEQFNWLLLVPGEKYDYELNMLCYADKQAVPITTISIEAIYIDGNRSTHFDALRDTFRIYRLLLRSVWASFAGVLLTEVLVFLFSVWLGYRFVLCTVFTAVLLSALVTILLNRYVVFRTVPYRDGRRLFVHAFCRGLLYTVGCLAVGYYFPNIPLFWSFNLFALLCIPLEYLLHRAQHTGRYRDVNKEKIS